MNLLLLPLSPVAGSFDMAETRMSPHDAVATAACPIDSVAMVQMRNVPVRLRFRPPRFKFCYLFILEIATAAAARPMVLPLLMQEAR